MAVHSFGHQLALTNKIPPYRPGAYKRNKQVGESGADGGEWGAEGAGPTGAVQTAQVSDQSLQVRIWILYTIQAFAIGIQYE